MDAWLDFNGLGLVFTGKFVQSKQRFFWCLISIFSFFLTNNESTLNWSRAFQNVDIFRLRHTFQKVLGADSNNDSGTGTGKQLRK